MTRRELPYGSWPTPITSELVVASAVRITDVREVARRLVGILHDTRGLRAEHQVVRAGTQAVVRNLGLLDNPLGVALPQALTATHERTALDRRIERAVREMEHRRLRAVAERQRGQPRR